jgi:DNA-binding protein HU-beta
MNKTELIDATHKAMCQESGYDKATAIRAVNGMLDSLHNALIRGEKVVITGFGSFEPVTRKGRKGRNPRTGEAVEIAPSVGVKFKPGKVLKEALNK